MSASAIAEWGIFLALSAIAVVTAGGMLVTMSMYRAALALMSSFVALAGLFVLLDADLLAVVQVMMNVGGMLVMLLFMVMIMLDPGGEMMWDMKRKMRLPGPGAFSMRMPKGPLAQDGAAIGVHGETTQQGSQEQGRQQTYTCPMHPEVKQDHPGQCPICGMDLVPAEGASDPSDGQRDRPTGQGEGDQDRMPGMGGMSTQQHHQMMVGMAMSTAQLPWALALGAASAALLIAVAVRTGWPLSAAAPTHEASLTVGELLLGPYMIGFEGAAMLILAGIAGAVILGKREGEPSPLAPQQATRRGRAYTCPMHPEVRQQEPGTCPMCGMDLVPADAGSGDDREQGRAYICPMHPEVQQQGPGTCPKCGTDLVPAGQESATEAGRE